MNINFIPNNDESKDESQGNPYRKFDFYIKTLSLHKTNVCGRDENSWYEITTSFKQAKQFSKIFFEIDEILFLFCWFAVEVLVWDFQYTLLHCFLK